MASIRTRKGSKFLIVDFVFMGQRCRETTNLLDTPANRKKLEKLSEKWKQKSHSGFSTIKPIFPKANERMS